MKDTQERVLITGISGFLGSRIALECLSMNYTVRGTIRNLKDPKKLEFLKNLPCPEKIEIMEADLSQDLGWDEATKNCTFVIHVASPIPISSPRNENDIIIPAIEGTIRVLKTAKTNKVKKIVITSSLLAMSTFNNSDKIINEMNWADLNKINAYSKSKVLAEKAAWDFYYTQNPIDKIEMTVLNPGFILGPSLVNSDFTSGEIIRKIMSNEILGIPRVYWPIVDVRDCATAHVKALKNIESNEKRIIITSEGLWFEQIIKILETKYKPLGYKFPKYTLPKFLVWIASFFSADVKELYPMLEFSPIYSNALSRKIFEIEYISPKISVLEMAQSMINFNRIPNVI